MAIDRTARKKAVTLDTLVRIGKKGISDSLIEEVRVHLKKRKLIKIRVLRSALFNIETGESRSAKSIGEEIAARSSSEIIQVIGQSIVLRKIESRKAKQL